MNDRSHTAKQLPWHLFRTGLHSGLTRFLGLFCRLSGLVLLVFLAAVFLSSCQSSGVSGDEYLTQMSTTPAAVFRATVTQPRTNAPIRLWWTPRDSFVPLLPDSAAGKAVNSLIFQGLYRNDASGQPVAVLAEQASVSDDGLTWNIKLREGIVFHDHSQVQVSDIVACTQFLLDPDRQPFSNLAGVPLAEVAAGTRNQVIFRLTRPFPGLLSALTFAILPAGQLQAAAPVLIAGTGPYRMFDWKSGDDAHLILQSVSDAGAPRLEVRAYADDRLAMRAFEQDQLDIAYLEAGFFSGINPRGGVRIQSVLTAQEILLACVSDTWREPGRLSALKLLLLPEQIDSSELSRFGLGSPLGLLPGHPLAVPAADVYRQTLNALVTAPPANWPPLRLLVPSEDQTLTELAAALQRLCQTQGITAEIISQPWAVFWTPQSRAAADLVLCRVFVPDAHQPDWLLQPERNALFALLLDLDQGFTDHAYIAARERLIQTDHANLAAYAQDLGEATARSSWIHLMIMREGIVYNSRVAGSLRPGRDLPYRNMEDLYLWSGRS